MATTEVWRVALEQMGVRPTTAERWAPAFAQHVQPEAFSLGLSELDDFMGQALHESGMLEHLEENLNYSPERLMAVWPKRFPSIQHAHPYAHNPTLLANAVYGGRMGNTEPGDGWRYRGRGIPMITGRGAYLAVGKLIGVDLEAQPERLLEPDTALRAAKAWWENNIPDSYMSDTTKVTRRVNGGTVGLADRQRLTSAAASALIGVA